MDITELATFAFLVIVCAAYAVFCLFAVIYGIVDYYRDDSSP